MKHFKLREFFFFLTGAVSVFCFVPGLAMGQCSGEEYTAVFIVDDFFSSSQPQLGLLSVYLVGEETNPTVPEMLESIVGAQPDFISWTDYELRGQEGDFSLFGHDPFDEGASVIVDSRNGRVVFFGTVIWLGQGDIYLPLHSSHTWSFTPEPPASEPSNVGVLPNQSWADYNGDPSVITDSIVDYLQNSDVLRSFSNCGPYDLVSYIYTPNGTTGLDPETASLIVFVSGKCGPPWSEMAASVDTSPDAGILSCNFPNPFNPSTTFLLKIPETTHVNLSIYSLDGKRICELADHSISPGSYFIPWDGMDADGRGVSSGTYFATVKYLEKEETISISLVR